MNINDIKGLYAIYFPNEDFRVLVAASSESMAISLGNTYARYAGLNGPCVSQVFTGNTRFDCDYLITAGDYLQEIKNESHIYILNTFIASVKESYKDDKKAFALFEKLFGPETAFRIKILGEYSSDNVENDYLSVCKHLAGIYGSSAERVSHELEQMYVDFKNNNEKVEMEFCVFLNNEERLVGVVPIPKKLYHSAFNNQSEGFRIEAVFKTRGKAIAMAKRIAEGSDKYPDVYVCKYKYAGVM